ncbi:uncharacterized protein CANTADRAFT_27195 [Suhomyces tanzawaensis NRRL Y-17324]|uniref:PX domain-containing protein n=1 Tax=Suhomyces tanzawaensis NRRL Y-17324 TaxID=984487 RepID=A0A1E4SD58_9ASCO|nr:uncharacterized protein CANTADRAFT_27195 [Suhomyces tanzawaensis NRRL Y-17324]ODV77322.1 hypothetical protein CANTADRAFT_27195 [Suhomyces tanzawaensis NRRL Y-17324]
MSRAQNHDEDIIKLLTPTQEHFLKKYILENRLSDELHQLNRPDFCEYLGFPFKSENGKDAKDQLPLLSFFFNNFLTTFPFITNNSKEDQLAFWQDTVQPFVESFNQKHISSSEDRQENVTKRRQVNKKFLSGLLLFYNSVIITEQDLTYLKESHLKASDTGKLDKITGKNDNTPIISSDLDDFHNMSFSNDTAINIVAVRHINKPNTTTGNSSDSSESSVNASWNPFKRFVSAPEKPRHHYEFVIQIVTRTEITNRKYSYERHYISRPYHEFKNFEKQLKKAFPGIISTEGLVLPHKAKHDKGLTEELNINRRSFESEKSEFSLLSGDSDSKLAREKLRMSLRGYLISLTKFPEIVHSPEFKRFMADSHKSFQDLTSQDLADYAIRVEHEQHILKTQLEFQQQITKVIMQLTKDFDSFKENLIKEPGTITEIFNDIGKSGNIKEMSPLLRTFNEWCKLEVAATLYQIFLGQDNSNEWLNKCKKFHFIFPYSMVYGILRFTNPVKITSRIIDLLLLNFPKFSFPSWGSSNEEAELQQKSGGARNLLSMIFIMLLNEDLSGFEKELTILKDEKIDPKFDPFLEKIRSYVDSPYHITSEIKGESIENGEDLLITILKTSLILPVFNDSESTSLLSQVIESFKAYDSLEKEKDLDKSELYLNLKQYWQIQIRSKDKDLFKQLWQEPELTKLIKNFLTIFYQPLMKVFAKSDMHIVFKSFQKFMDDLLKELTQLSKEEMYFLSAIEIFDKLKSLLDNHEDVMWNFIHNVYIKDDQHIFLKLFKWIEEFLVLIRLKFEDESKVKLHMSTQGLGIDNELFMKQLNSRANKVVEKRRLFKEYMEKKSKESMESTQGKLDKQWDDVNNEMFEEVDVTQFGVGSADMDDFNYLHVEDDFNEGADTLERELKRKLFNLERELENFGTSELDKLDIALKPELSTLLKNIPTGLKNN